MRRTLCVLAFASAFIPDVGAAHDFWLQPDRFVISSGEAVGVALRVGHAGDSERSPMPRRRILRFEAVAPNGGVQTVTALPTTAVDDARPVLSGEGVHVLVLETDNEAYSQLPAERFEAHLASEGLTPAMEARARTGRTGLPGSERYGRRAKALIQVGEAGAAEAGAKPAGLTLEIVPRTNPYALKGPARLAFEVLYEGRPLEGALVKLKDLDTGAELAAARTDAKGTVTMALAPTGRWLATTVWTRPLPEDASADFETIFASLTFAREPAR